MAGFFALMVGFPLGDGFILRVRKASFLRDTPLTVDVTNRTVITPSNNMMMTVSRLAGTPMVGGREACIRYWEASLAWWEGIPRV